MAQVIIHENLEKAIESLERDSFLMANWSDLVSSPVISVVKRDPRIRSDGKEKEVEVNNEEIYGDIRNYRIVKDLENSVVRKDTDLLSRYALDNYFKSSYFTILAFKEKTPKLAELHGLIKEALRKGYGLPEAIEKENKKNNLDFLVGRRVIKLYRPDYESLLRGALEEVEELKINKKGEDEYSKIKLKSLPMEVYKKDLETLEKFLKFFLETTRLENLRLLKYRDGIPEEMSSEEEGRDLLAREAIKAKYVSKERSESTSRVEIPITNDYGGKYLIRNEDSGINYISLTSQDPAIREYIKRNESALGEEIVLLRLEVEEKEDIIHLVPVERWKSELVVQEWEERGFDPRFEFDNVRFIAFSEFSIKKAEVLVSKVGRAWEVSPIRIEARKREKGENYDLRENQVVVEIDRDVNRSINMGMENEEMRRVEGLEGWKFNELTLDWKLDKLEVTIKESRKMVIEIEEGEEVSWRIKRVEESRTLERGKATIEGKTEPDNNPFLQHTKKSEIEEKVLEEMSKGTTINHIKEGFAKYLIEELKSLVKRYKEGETSPEALELIESSKEFLVDIQSVFQELEKRVKRLSEKELKEAVEIIIKTFSPRPLIAKVDLSKALGKISVKNYLSDKKAILYNPELRLCFNNRELGRVYIDYGPTTKEKPNSKEVVIPTGVLRIVKRVLIGNIKEATPKPIEETDTYKSLLINIRNMNEWIKGGKPKGANLILRFYLGSSSAIGKLNYADKKYKTLNTINLDRAGYLFNLDKGLLEVYIDPKWNYKETGTSGFWD